MCRYHGMSIPWQWESPMDIGHPFFFAVSIHMNVTICYPSLQVASTFIATSMVCFSTPKSRDISSFPQVWTQLLDKTSTFSLGGTNLMSPKAAAVQLYNHHPPFSTQGASWATTLQVVSFTTATREQARLGLDTFHFVGLKFTLLETLDATMKHMQPWILIPKLGILQWLWTKPDEMLVFKSK